MKFTFITFDDFDLVIQKEIREIAIDSEQLLEIANSTAWEVRGRLAKKFNVTEIFAQEGENRDSELVERICDIAIYKAFKRVAPDLISEIRSDALADAREWLAKITLSEDHKEVIYCNLALNKNFGSPDMFFSRSDRKFNLDW